MRSQFFPVAAATLLATMPMVFAGKARVYNHCDFVVYSWSVDTEQNPSSSTPISSGGGMYEEDFRKPAEGGVSIKLSPTDDVYVPITQLEYTINSDTWYDVSNVDCHGTECPFQKHGLYLESGPNCPTVSCKPGNLTCHGAYTLWDDNWASLCCTDPDVDIVLHLCRDSPGGSSEGPSVESYDAPAPKPHKPHKAVPSDYETPTPTPSPSPTSYEPYTQVVPVTEVATVVVTVTPDSGNGYDDSSNSDDYSGNSGDSGNSDGGYSRMRRRRHIHNHMDAHNRRH